MGHTFVTKFSGRDIEHIRQMLQKAGAEQTNKIPYGRKCDRAAADAVLPYHVTLFHWGRKEDACYLGRLQQYTFPGAYRITAVKPVLTLAEEGSLLLKLEVKPSAGFDAMIRPLEALMQCPASKHLHLTLAVSKDHSEMKRLCRKLQEVQPFPFELTVTGLGLYQIWDPVRLVKSFE